jgi:splicing factor 3B subunit 3
MATSPLPFKPTRVMTLKQNIGESLDKYLIVSSIDSSLILGVTEGKISSISETNFVKNEPTIHVCTLEDNSHVQVTETSIIHIRSHVSNNLKNTKWSCDIGRKITRACSNSRQLII